MSLGRRSGVNWMRSKPTPSACASDFTSRVLRETRHAFEQYVPAREQRDLQSLDDLELSQHSLADFAGQPAGPLSTD